MTGSRHQAACAALAFVSAPTWSESPLGAYVGAGVGQSNVALERFPADALAWGGGIELKVSAIGLRAEYERFGSGSTRPSLASLAVVWSF